MANLIYSELQAYPLISIDEWRRRILKVIFIDHKTVKSTTKETIFSNFTGHIDNNTEPAFSSLIKDGLLEEVRLKDKIHYCLNIFEKANQIHSEMDGINSKLLVDIDQPLDNEFANLRYVFTTEANRAYPNRGKYYHCTKSEDETFWITLVKPKGNSKSKRLIMGSLKNPKTRLYKIHEAIKIVARESRSGTIVKKHVEDIETKACGNTRQYSKTAFDILGYLNEIQEVESKGRMIKYRLVKDPEERSIQLTLDDVFDDVSKMQVRVY